METYIGTKTIKAKAMNLGDYKALRGWTSPESPFRDLPLHDTWFDWSDVLNNISSQPFVCISSQNFKTEDLELGMSLTHSLYYSHG